MPNSWQAFIKINADFSVHVTLKFDGWPWKTIGHLFYTMSSFVHHFKSIGEFKLKLQSGNAQLRWKLGDFLSRVTLKFDIWPWNTIRHLFYTMSSCVYNFSKPSVNTTSSYSPETPSLGQNQWFFSVILTFDGWPWKLIGHLFDATSSFVPHFIAIGELKLKLQSGNPQFG